MQPRGRPRSFDRDAALDVAMRVFWSKGYEGTTVADLTQAMGVKPPSFYGAFGDKGSLFREVVRRYLETEGAAPLRALQEAPTLREGLHAMLQAAITLYAAPGGQGGCLVVTAAVNCTPEQAQHAAELAVLRRRIPAAITERLEQARASGELPAKVDHVQLAGYLATVLQGLALRAKDGASHTELAGSVALALSVLDWKLAA